MERTDLAVGPQSVPESVGSARPKHSPARASDASPGVGKARVVGTLACLVVLLSWAARLRGLGAHSLWLDEAVEVGRASAPWPLLLRSRVVDMDPPLYSVVMRLWLALGPNDFLARVPSVVFGVLAAALMVAWLRRHGSRTVALLGGLIFALAPVQVHYAQEVNQYSLVGLLAVATLMAFERVDGLMTEAHRARILPFAALLLVSALDVYTYYGLFWLILALDVVWAARLIRRRGAEQRTAAATAEGDHGGSPVRIDHAAAASPSSVGAVPRSLPVSSSDRPGWRAWLAYQAGMLAVALSLLPFSLEGQVLRGLAAWKGQYAQLGRGDVLQQLAGGAHGSLVAFGIAPFGEPPGLIVAAYGLLLLGAASTWRRGGMERLVAPLTLGVVMAFVASGYGLYAFQGRHLLFAAPLVYALVAVGMEAAVRGERPAASGQWPVAGEEGSRVRGRRVVGAEARAPVPWDGAGEALSTDSGNGLNGFEAAKVAVGAVGQAATDSGNGFNGFQAAGVAVGTVDHAAMDSGKRSRGSGRAAAGHDAQDGVAGTGSGRGLDGFKEAWRAGRLGGWRRAGFRVVAAGFFLGLVMGWPQPLGPAGPWWRGPAREELRPVLAQVRATSRPDDAVYVYYAAGPAFRFYQAAGITPVGDVTYQVGWPQGDVERQALAAAAALAKHQRGWLIFSHVAEGEDNAVVRALAAPGGAWRAVETYAAENARAVLLLRAGDD